MKIALGIVDLFASGGLQRDCLAVYDMLRRRGHDVTLYCARCTLPEGGPPVTLLDSMAWTNHGRDVAFSQRFQMAARPASDVVVGFNKLAGLDVLYCADPSVKERPTAAWKRALPRHRTRHALEQACFGPQSITRCLLLTEAAAAAYRAAWATPAHRIDVLPPTIAIGRIKPQLRETAMRLKLRQPFGFAPAAMVWLWIGTQPRTKGLDRVIDALARSPDAHLLIAGLDADSPKAAAALKQARATSTSCRMTFLGHREDIPELMAASDLMVHPARLETTGQAVLEAVANGLPVIVSGACGFASHVAGAGCGVVIAEPFDPRDLDDAVGVAADPQVRAAWSRAGRAYAERHDLTGGLAQAASLIEASALNTG